MKKKLLYCLTFLFALGLASCQEDLDTLRPANPAEDFDRMPMTMFRLEENTGVSNDPYGTRVITEELNTVELAWYGVEGAAGYEIKFGLMPGLTSGLESDWNDESRLYQWEDGKYSKILPPDQLTLRIENLEYGTDYRFAIRVLNPDGIEEHHSRWYGYGDGRQWADQCGLRTEDRYNTPGVMNVTDIAPTKDAFTVVININVVDALDSYCVFEKEDTDAQKEAKRQEVFEDFKRNFELVKDGTENDFRTAKFKITHLQVNPSSETPNATIDTKWNNYVLSDNDYVNGVANLRVTGLAENSIYLVNVVNNDIPVAVDSRYNTVRKPVYGEPGEPILIEHKVRATDSIPGEVKYQACYLDEIIGSFATNVMLAEGQTFYLEGGKAYYFYANPTLSKGFTLETRPEDVAAGKRAKVYMGGIGVGLNSDGTKTATIATSNFMFGKQKGAGEADCPIEVGSVIFRNIDFDCPEALNYGHQAEGAGSASGNYFANMYSDGMEVVFQSFEVYNCTFQRMVRGFFRVQGSKDKTFEKIVIDGNLFYNCGYYANDGRGYAWFAGDGGRVSSNIYKNFYFTNNTVYDSPRTSLITDNDKNIEYTDNVKWNINIEDNTFINFSTRSSGRNFFQTRYVPGGSYYSFQRNLIVLAADDNDQRALYQTGADIREIKGSGLFSFEVKDNYSLGCRDSHLADNKIFTGSEFSNTKNSFGAATWNPGNLGAKEDLTVKAVVENGKALKATDVFNSPNPGYTNGSASVYNHRDHEAPANIYNALKYKNTPSVLQNVGDKRWMSAEPEHYYDNL